VKNITLSLDEETYRMARIKAAERSTSVSALVKAYLLQLARGEKNETDFERLQREERELREELRAQRLGLNSAHNLSRDELHDRHALR
jgi:hypothetical protein